MEKRDINNYSFCTVDQDEVKLEPWQAGRGTFKSGSSGFVCLGRFKVAVGKDWIGKIGKIAE